MNTLLFLALFFVVGATLSATALAFAKYRCRTEGKVALTAGMVSMVIAMGIMLFNLAKLREQYFIEIVVLLVSVNVLLAAIPFVKSKTHFRLAGTICILLGGANILGFFGGDSWAFCIAMIATGVALWFSRITFIRTGRDTKIVILEVNGKHIKVTSTTSINADVEEY